MKPLRMLLITICCLIYEFSFGQCFSNTNAFTAGERISYSVVYSWGFLWMQVGEVSFEVKKTYFNQRDVYQFIATGVSLSRYDWFFKVRDIYQAYFDAKLLKPLKYIGNTAEMGTTSESVYIFDYVKNKVYTSVKISDKSQKNDTIAITPCTYDILSAVYYCRSLDFAKMSVNQVTPVSVVVDNKIVTLKIKNCGKEDITLNNGICYKCIKFNSVLMDGTIFKGGEEVNVWVSDDDNRIPVYIEAQIVIGKVKANLATTKGLRHPELAKQK